MAAAGAGFDENVPDPDALNGPSAGNAWLPFTVPVAKLGISDDKLNETFSFVASGNPR